ncbi:MAG: PHP domain-containing protein [Oscillospiraceae bacterium]|nr:PHP domain-containing protein [Oscillospiraceae bacterium]
MIELSNGVDLHVHTNASDGSNPPEEVVRLAAEAGLQAIAITEHDNTNSLARSMAAGQVYGVEVIPGIELSADYKGIEVHILGYFIDPDADSLCDLLEIALANREVRNQKICARLREEGIEVTMEELRARHPGTVLGRPHIGLLMMEKGYVESVRRSFREYMGKGAKCYIPKVNMPMERAISRILAAGGVPVLAHPFQYELPEEELRELIELVIGLGCAGMECIYARYDDAQRAYLCCLAEEYGLIITAGSDYHGTPKPDILLGDIRGDYGQVQQLREKCGK